MLVIVNFYFHFKSMKIMCVPLGQMRPKTFMWLIAFSVLFCFVYVMPAYTHLFVSTTLLHFVKCLFLFPYNWKLRWECGQHWSHTLWYPDSRHREFALLFSWCVCDCICHVALCKIVALLAGTWKQKKIQTEVVRDRCGWLDGLGPCIATPWLHKVMTSALGKLVQNVSVHDSILDVRAYTLTYIICYSGWKAVFTFILNPDVKF